MGITFFILCNGVWTWRRMGRCCVSSRTVRLACGKTNLIWPRYARDLTSGFRHTPLTPSAPPGTDTLSCCNFPHSLGFPGCGVSWCGVCLIRTICHTRLICPMRWPRVSVGNGSGTSLWSEPSDSRRRSRCEACPSGLHRDCFGTRCCGGELSSAVTASFRSGVLFFCFDSTDSDHCGIPDAAVTLMKRPSSSEQVRGRIC